MALAGVLLTLDVLYGVLAAVALSILDLMRRVAFTCAPTHRSLVVRVSAWVCFTAFPL
jgi:MFS superfamily sulfate permease-like transporter